MLSNFGIIILFVIGAILFVAVTFGISKLWRPNNPTEEKITTYESGEEPLGNANIQFNVRFYIVALIFILFDVELVFLFPWSVVFGQKKLLDETHGWWGWFTLIEMAIFIFLLVIGLAYAWRRGYLDWVRPEQKELTFESNIPTSAYTKVNKKYAKK